jgi:RNA recognition motif-containing protein
LIIKTARSKGFAFVEFEFKEVAEIACKALNGYIMQNK